MPTEGDHRHCRVCGRMVRTEQETCGPECAAERARRVRTAKGYRYALYGAIAILLILVLTATL